ncbi:MAG: hypothetical protein E7623_00775 [Ruminococcaceae bacterium]|nr:hypothetical protein [Oscillospiraceae bacterium]
MNEFKNNNQENASAEDLLTKLDENLGGTAQKNESSISRELRDIGRQLKGEDALGEDEDLLNDFFEKEIGEVDLSDIYFDGDSSFDEMDDNSGDEGFLDEIMNGNGGYVADHAEDSAKTRVAGVSDNDLFAEDFEDMDDIDRDLMLTFGQEEELASKIGEDRVNELSEDNEIQGEFFESTGAGLSSSSKVFEEYTSAEQTDEIILSYAKKHRAATVSFSLVSVFMLIALFVENMSKIGITPADIFQPSVYPVVYLMIELQLVLLSAAAVYKAFVRGTVAIVRLKPLPESIVVTLTILAAICISVIAAAFPVFATGIYVFPLILAIWFVALQELLDIKREVMSFSIVSSKSQKFALSKLNIENSELETAAFYESLPDKPTIYKICKADFVEKYFRRTSGMTRNKLTVGAALPISVIIGIAFFFVGMFTKDAAAMGFISAYNALMFCTPVTMILAFAIPAFKSSRSAFAEDGAIIGEGAISEYADASVISFDDREVFPSFGVKVKSVKIYGKNRIDRVIYNTASLFEAVGGPLADVFDVATVELGKSKDVDLNDIQQDGIEAYVDGVRVCVGKADYVSRQGLTPYYDMEDDQIESCGDISIMYVICGDNVAAKMYIQYMVDPDFEVLIDQLHKTGVCVGIKTLDPNIDDRLLSEKINMQKYPVRMIRCRSVNDMDFKEDSVDSGIVSKNSAKGLLKLVAMCDKVKNSIKTNMVLSAFSLCIGLAISIFLMATDMSIGISSFLVGLYHIFWALPILLASKTLS